MEFAAELGIRILAFEKVLEERVFSKIGVAENAFELAAGVQVGRVEAVGEFDVVIFERNESVKEI